MQGEAWINLMNEFIHSFTDWWWGGNKETVNAGIAGDQIGLEIGDWAK